MVEHKFVTRDKEILGGIPVFAGTRVPLKTLFDYLEKGHSLDGFLDDFPTVAHDQATALLEFVKQTLREPTYESVA